MPAINRRDWLRSVVFGAAAMPRLTGRRNLSAQGSRPARAYRYIHLDVFTDRRLAGNQLPVYLNPEGLDADTMARLTLESNYSENTFVFPPAQPGSNFRVRIFGQTGEIPFAGHPTIGTAFALAHAGRIKPPTASSVFGLGIGPTPIDLEWQGNDLIFAWMTLRRPTFGRSITDAAGVASALGLQAADIAAAHAPAAQDVDTGANYIIVPLASRKAVDAAVVDPLKLCPLRAANGLTGFAVYAFTTESGGDGATSYSRLLPVGACPRGPGHRIGGWSGRLLHGQVWVRCVRTGRRHRQYARRARQAPEPDPREDRFRRRGDYAGKGRRRERRRG